MALVSHAFPKFVDAINNKTVTVGTDTMKVLLTGAGTVTWNSTTQGYTFVQDLLTGAALTELAATGGYTTGGVTLTTVSRNLSTTFDSLVVGTNPSWSSATFTASFAIWYDTSIGTNYATWPLVAYWDFGGAVGVSTGTFTLSIPSTNGVAGALVQWTAA